MLSNLTVEPLLEAPEYTTRNTVEAGAAKSVKLNSSV